MLVFAGRGAADARLVERRGGTAQHQADVEGKVRLGQLGAEGGEDAGQLVDRPVAGFGAEDAAGMARLAGRAELPGGGAAAGDRPHVATVLDRQPLEVEGDVGALRRLHEVAAGDGDRIAGILLVAGEHDLDIGRPQRPGRVHRPQGGDHHRHAALVVADSRPFDRVGILAGEALERRIGLEHRVEMADQQQPPAAAVAAMDGDDMPGAAGLRHRHPLHLEAERLELGAHHPPDRFDPGEVERAAVLVDQPLEQIDGARLLAIHGLYHLLLGGAQPCVGGRSGEGEEGEQGEEEGFHRRSCRNGQSLATVPSCAHRLSPRLAVWHKPRCRAKAPPVGSATAASAVIDRVRSGSPENSPTQDRRRQLLARSCAC
jgi:hypothetical protein